MAIDAERRQSLLIVAGERSRQVDSAGTFGAVKAPNGLGHNSVHVDRLTPVAPAGSYCEGDAHAFAPELLGARCRLRGAADTSVSQSALHRLAVGVAQVVGKEFGGRPCHLHHLAFE